jgi:hypothetical protein
MELGLKSSWEINKSRMLVSQSSGFSQSIKLDCENSSRLDEGASTESKMLDLLLIFQ